MQIDQEMYQGRLGALFLCETGTQDVAGTSYPGTCVEAGTGDEAGGYERRRTA